MVRNVSTWARRPAGLVVLALVLGACGAASAAPGFDPSSSSNAGVSVEQLSATMQPCSSGGTALSKLARAPSGPATDASGAIQRLESVPVAGPKLATVDVVAAAASAGAQAPASGATVKFSTPAGSGATRIVGGAIAVPAEPCT